MTVPSYGVTKDEHDAQVARTGRNYTEPQRWWWRQRRPDVTVADRQSEATP